MIEPITLSALALAGAGIGWQVAQAQASPISYDSPVTLAILFATVSAAFGVGTLLTGIRRDIKELQRTMTSRPCFKRGQCSIDHDPEDLDL